MFGRLQVVLLSLAAAACAPSIPSGHFACTSDEGCPSGWQCVGGRCFDEAPADFDAGTMDSAVPDRDAAVPDAGPDAAPLPDGGSDAGIPELDAGPCVPAATAVDLLVMVDDSNSMAEEQATLAADLPAVIDALARGDSDGDGRRDFMPVADLHVGVVSSDMGTRGYPIASCNDRDFGDDGILNDVASPDLTGCDPSYPPFLSFRVGTTSIDDFRTDFACVASLGTSGCGLEQQLDAVLKALTPSTSAIRFHMDTTGHGDGANLGFLRPDSVLVVLLVTDEDDCSASDGRLFDFTLGGPYDATHPALRCAFHPEALHPLARYVDGLRALRAEHPERLVFMALGGTPVDSDGTSIADLLGDSRMTPVAAADGMSLVPVCSTARGLAWPARRLAEAALAIDGTESTGLVRSICQDSYAPAFSELLRATVRALAGTCG